MRRSLMLLGIAILLVTAAQVPAQEQPADDDQSSLYVATVYLNRVYTHRLGYKILYQRNDLSLGEAFIPNQWFRTAAGKAELINTHSDAAPYMEIYYDEGEFSYVRLYVRSDPNHISWGSLRPGEVSPESFDQESLNIRY